jgi:hypothetical protein
MSPINGLPSGIEVLGITGWLRRLAGVGGVGQMIIGMVSCWKVELDFKKRE